MSSAIKEFKKDPDGYKDYATLMGGLKVLQGDESVVREAEIRLGMSAADLATAIRNWGEQLISGQKLSPKQRDQIVNTIDILKETSRRQYLDAIQPVLLHAESSNIDKKFLVNQGFLANEDVSPQEKLSPSISIPEALLKDPKIKPGAIINTKDGFSYKVNPDGKTAVKL